MNEQEYKIECLREEILNLQAKIHQLMLKLDQLNAEVERKDTEAYD